MSFGKCNKSICLDDILNKISTNLSNDIKVNQNNIGTQTKAELWLETMKDGCKKVNKMFNLNIDVDLRFKPQLERMETGFGEVDVNDSEK